MQISKWRHLIKLFIWQRRRGLVLLAAFAIALSIVVDVFGADGEISSTLWTPELGYSVMVGLLISLAVAVLND